MKLQKRVYFWLKKGPIFFNLDLSIIYSLTPIFDQCCPIESQNTNTKILGLQVQYVY